MTFLHGHRPSSARLLQVDVQVADLPGVIEGEDGQRIDHVDIVPSEMPLYYLTKDEIFLAAAEAELARLEAVIAAAESEPSRRRARDAALTGIVDLAVDRRRTVSAILSDPVIVGFFADHKVAIQQGLRSYLKAGPLGLLVDLSGT